MDVFSHAFAGACTGAAFGHPVTGAVVAVLPDIALVGPRRRLPPLSYNVAHSFLFLAAATAVGSLWGMGFLVYFCLLSHLVLDFPTHGKDWAPPLMWPMRRRYSMTGQEWEWLDDTWKFGFLLTLLWSLMWLLIAPL